MEHSIDSYKALILNLTLSLGVRVYIAGGAVRDVLLDRADKVRDLDLWIYTDNLEKTREDALNSSYLGERTRRVGNEKANLGRDGQIIAIDYFVKDGQEINLIYLKAPIGLPALLRDFDFGINQAGICPHYGLWASDHFHDSVLTSRLIVTRKDSPERAAQRLEKMRSKFPDWTVSDVAPLRVTPSKPLDFGYDDN